MTSSTASSAGSTSAIQFEGSSESLKRLEVREAATYAPEAGLARAAHARRARLHQDRPALHPSRGAGARTEPRTKVQALEDVKGSVLAVAYELGVNEK
jgi:hypothetical protein